MSTGRAGAGSAATPADVLVVSLGATGGLREADSELARSLGRAGAQVELVTAVRPREVRTFAATDLGWALAARRAAAQALARRPARAVIYSSVTAALLWPRRGAIRFDALAAANRPGRHGIWQRPLERRRLAQAGLWVPCSRGSLSEAGADPHDRRAVVVPIAVARSGPLPGSRDIAAMTYVANFHKKGVDRLLEAWARARRPGEELLLAGAQLSVREEGVRVVGRLGSTAYRALLRRTRVFAAAARREDYGVAQLEALADGCQLVTVASPGPYAALPLARTLDPRLVGEDLAGALRCALDSPLEGYAARAAQLLRPYSIEQVDRLVATELLPRLLRG